MYNKERLHVSYKGYVAMSGRLIKIDISYFKSKLLTFLGKINFKVKLILKFVFNIR